MPNYQTICTILSELWMNHRDDKDFKEFIEYSDLGLPLAYFLAEGLVEEITEMGQQYVQESFEMLTAGLGLDSNDIPDGTSLLGLFEMSQNKK